MSFVFLSPEANKFVSIMMSFPTIILTLLLVLQLLYWLLIILDFAPISINKFDHLFVDPGPVLNRLTTFGVVGVPATVAIGLMTLIGWVASYWAVDALPLIITDTLLIWPVGLVVLLGALVVGLVVSGQLIQAFSGLFSFRSALWPEYCLGATGQVRTSRVDQDFGEARLDSKYVGLLVQVRTTGKTRFKAGDTIQVVSHQAQDNTYLIEPVTPANESMLKGSGVHR